MMVIKIDTYIRKYIHDGQNDRDTDIDSSLIWKLNLK